MLILAGVSMNAIVGENGILTRTQYATFLNEMAAVEEAVGMWKAGEAIEAGGQTTAIPTNGLCKVNDLTNAERLTGEVGYYRIWSMTETAPTTNILSSASEFNSNFESELVFYPAGVQDLYYLNNEACGIDSKKTYLIDAATGMVYSMTGINLKGVNCYSSNMAKAVMNGDMTSPIFASAEVSGTGSGEKLAGNIQSEFLEDGKTPNPDYNPNGFQIIAGANNIFKLYNNGDLYGKGVKGPQLNTSTKDMEKINQYVWKEWKVPQEVGEYKKIIIGSLDAMFFIDKNDDLWVYGSNSADNKFGLTQEQQVEYTGREAMKVDLNGKKVSKVFSGHNSTFLITKDNCLLAAGTNNYSQLGLGHNRKTTKFEEVNVSNVENIERIYCSEQESLVNIIRYKDNTFFVAGVDNRKYTTNTWKNYTTFEQVWTDIDQDIKDLSWTCQCLLLKYDGTLWLAGDTGYVGGGLSSEKVGNFTRYELEDIDSFYPCDVHGALLVTNNGAKNEYYALGVSKSMGINNSLEKTPTKIDILDSVNVKDIFYVYETIYILSEEGELYAAGNKKYLGLNDSVGGFTENFIKLDIKDINTLYSDEMFLGYNNRKSIVLLNKDGKYYTTGNSTLMFGNAILQQNWGLVAQNVKFFNGKGNCYVDKENNLWVAGDSRYYGLGERSEVYEKIPNYIKCTDTNISGKVDKCYNVGCLTYVLLNNKELWATGLYTNNDTLRKTDPGWEGTENKTNFVKISENVLFFDICPNSWYTMKIIGKSNGEILAWGTQVQGSNGIPGSWAEFSSTISKVDIPSTMGGANNVSVAKMFAELRTSIITKDGKVFYTGKHSSSWDGGHPSTETFSEYTHNLNLNEGEKIIDLVSSTYKSALFLTNQGRVYGYGPKNKIGIGETSEEIETHLIEGLKGKNIVQLVGRGGFYIAIDSEGKVYGTGSNIYGILGRWIGIDRNSPNSRYKTAFEWVECPELEI